MVRILWYRINKVIFVSVCWMLAVLMLSVLLPNVEAKADYTELITAAKRTGKVVKEDAVEGNTVVSVVENDDFRITLKTDKASYQPGDSVSLTAIVEYIGSDAEKEITCCSEPVVFRIEGSNGLKGDTFTYYNKKNKNAFTFKKGEKYEFPLKIDRDSDFRGDVGTAFDPDLWEEQYASEICLPEGTYTFLASLSNELLNKKSTSFYAELHLNIGTDGDVFHSGNHLYRTNGESEAVLIGSRQMDGDFSVPETVSYKGKKYTVTVIGDDGIQYETWVDEYEYGTRSFGAFSLRGYSSVNIPATVRKISRSAFSECWGLRDIIIKSDDLEICEGAFSGCGDSVNDTKLDLSGGRIRIGKGAFLACLLGEINIHDCESLEISERAFSENFRLKTIKLPDNTISIGNRAFYESYDANNSTMRATLTIPKGTIQIGYAIANKLNVKVAKGNGSFVERYGLILSADGTTIYGIADYKLKEVAIPEGVSVIAPYAFSQSKIKKITIPDTVSVIPEGMALGAGKLKSVSLGKGVKEIGDHAFQSTKIKKIKLPNGLKSIGEYAFAGCKIKKVTIPKSVEELGNNSFACYSWPDVTIKKGNKSFEQKGDAIFEPGTKTVIGLVYNNIDDADCEKLDLRFVLKGSIYSINIPESVKEIDISSFSSELMGEYYSGLNEVYAGAEIIFDTKEPPKFVDERNCGKDFWVWMFIPADGDLAAYKAALEEVGLEEEKNFKLTNEPYDEW